MKWLRWSDFSRFEGLSEDQNRVYRNFNIFAAIGLLDILVVAAALSGIEPRWPFYACLSEFVLLLIILFFHCKGYLIIARYSAFILILFLQTLASLTHGPSAGFDLLFFAISVLPLLFFEEKRHYLSLFIIGLCTHLWVKYQIQTLTPVIIINSDFPLYWNTFVTASIIFGVMFAFKLGYQRSRSRLLQQNKDILHQKEEIESINNNLEHLVVQRTQKVKEHQQLFTEYANINAHKVRSPLARIMGLLNIIELEKDREKILRELLPLLKENAEDLNGILDEVSRSLNAVNHANEKAKDLE